MYYSVEEMNDALLIATSVINQRTKLVENYTLNYNDCWALVKEYDKALRGTSLLDINFEYKNQEDFFKQLDIKLKELVINSGYEIIRNNRPKFGDVAYEVLYGNGSAMIAGEGCWVTTSENNSGVLKKRKRFFKETRLSILARPLRS